MTYTDKYSKLPKWAQDEIKVLQMNNRALLDKISQFTGQTKTNTYLRDGLEFKPLPMNANVEFKTGENQLNKASIYVKSNGIIVVNTDSRLGESMVIVPQAASSFHIVFVKN